ncbi:MAG: ATPase, T2SS/T4P/T4SS family [Byssovorax sp.]
MFSVIISEKGGAERREAFDRTEINVGRVQGNELMLPKGNVSKRHARLLYRDGRFIVTDLKSTNGTYVNGRKIAQATIVREGDKIYIGDFVLRIESAASAGGQPAATPLPLHEEVPNDATPPSGPPPAGPQTSAQIPVASLVHDARGSVPDFGGPPAQRGPSLSAPGYPSAAPIAAGGSGLPPSIEVPSSSSQPSSVEKSLGRAPSPRIEPKSADVPSRQDVISHFPLEHDPDDAAMYVPGPPRVPLATGPQTPSSPFAGGGPRPISRAPQPRPLSGPTPTTPAPSPERPGSPSVAPIERSTSPSMGLAQNLLYGAVQSSAPPATGPSVLPSSLPGRRALPPGAFDPPDAAPPSRIAAHRSAIVTLIDAVSEMLDLRALDGGGAADEALAARIDRALAERAAAMRAQGEIRAEIDVDTLIVEARRELLDLGPLGPLFDDEDVSEIQVVRSDYVVAMHGRRQIPSDLCFSSEAAVARAIRRLCVSAGKPLQPGEVFVERRLPRGARMFAVLPPASDQGHMVVIRKPQRADLTLEDLVRSGTISRAMAGLFAQCVEARANILVTGALGAGATSLLGALAAAGSTNDRVVVLQEDDELIFNQPHTISILLGETPEEGARAVHAAARIRPDRLVVGAFAGTVAAEVVDAMGDGVDGVLAAARAPTLRQAAARLTADLAATKPGLTPDIAREWLTSAFDLVIEIARLRDGRHRVLRVAELEMDGNRVTVRDIFTFAVERTAAGGAVEGSFHPTGVVPGIVEDLAARGIQIDASIFKRHNSR